LEEADNPAYEVLVLCTARKGPECDTEDFPARFAGTTKLKSGIIGVVTRLENEAHKAGWRRIRGKWTCPSCLSL